MDDYILEVKRDSEQVDAGRVITLTILNSLPESLGIHSNKFRFKQNRRETRPDQEVILDYFGRILASIPLEWLQDAHSTPEARAKIRARLRDALSTQFR